jgi:hypothetical protein
LMCAGANFSWKCPPLALQRQRALMRDFGLSARFGA